MTLEFAARVEGDGGRTLHGRPLPYGEPAAYWAFGAVIREACGIFATDSADVAAHKLGERAASLLPSSEARELARNLSILARLAEDTVEDRQALFASAQRFLEALAREQPTLVVLEDLHWADDSLVELIEALSVRLAGVPLLLLAIARPEFLDARPIWARLPTNVTVQVQALTDSCAHELVRQLLAGATDQEAVARRVERGGGRQSAVHRGTGRVAFGGRRRGRRRAPGEPQGDHRRASRPAAGARAAGDPRRVRGRRLLLAGQPARRSAATARSRVRCRRSSAGTWSAAARRRGSQATRSWPSSTG